jgi:hypothetical protein
MRRFSAVIPPRLDEDDACEPPMDNYPRRNADITRATIANPTEMPADTYTMSINEFEICPAYVKISVISMSNVNMFSSYGLKHYLNALIMRLMITNPNEIPADTYTMSINEFEICPA